MKKLNLNVAINNLGYGVVGYNVWKELRKITDITLWPIAHQIHLPIQPTEEILENIRADCKKQNDFFPLIPSLKIWHENQLADRIGSGRFHVYPFFEVTKFNQRRKSHLKAADKIIVASAWAGDIINHEIDRPAHIVPCGVDRSIFNDVNIIHNSKKCIFFTCGKWEIRKGHDILYKAFTDAFSNNEDVELWMMTSNPFLSNDERIQWESLYKRDNRIKLIQRVQYQEDLASIMKKTYCGVFPARSEGWNLELLEMMSTGRQVIATNFSAHKEFCNRDNCRLIDILETEPIYDGKWFVGDDGEWACLDGQPYDQLVSHMRDVYVEWMSNPMYINYMGVETAQKFSWAKTANKLYSVIFGEEYV